MCILPSYRFDHRGTERYSTLPRSHSRPPEQHQRRGRFGRRQTGPMSEAGPPSPGGGTRADQGLCRPFAPLLPGTFVRAARALCLPPTPAPISRERKVT